MNNLPREKLIQIIQENGISITNNPQQCKAFLLDYCGEYRLEINVLMSALQEGIVKELKNINQGIPLESILAKLRQQLETNLGIREDIAQWAVESWAIALGILKEVELRENQNNKPYQISSSKQTNSQQKNSSQSKVSPTTEKNYHERIIHLGDSLYQQGKGEQKSQFGKEETQKNLATGRTKIYIGNLPLEVTESDVRAIFAKYGSVESVKKNGRYAYIYMKNSKEA